MFDNLRRDCIAYKGTWYRRAGFWITAVYRFGNWADSLPSVVLRVPFWTLYLCFNLAIQLFSNNVYVWAGRRGARIGPGFCLYHPANVMIGRGAEIGTDCRIYHEVTLGTGQIDGVPKICDRVSVFPGARILGGVVIGSDSMVGANCVVTRDVPPNSTILAAPSRVIPNTLSRQVRQWSNGKEPVQPLNKQPPAP
jgi:serine O-acetyltransferase